MEGPRATGAAVPRSTDGGATPWLERGVHSGGSMLGGRMSRSRTRARAAIVALVAVPMAAAPLTVRGQTSPTPTPTPHPEVRPSRWEFALDLAGREDLAPVALDLGPDTPPSPPRGSGFGRLALELGPPSDPVPGIDLGPLESPPDWIVSGDRDQWPSPDPLMERHLAAELDRILTGQPWGRAPAFLMFDAVEIVEAVGRLFRRWRDRRLPPGALLPREGAAVLRVAESDGPPPATISVVPLAADWVGETVHGACDAAGRCEIAGLPDAPSVLLVIGAGGAVVEHPGGDAALDVTLRPLGRLRLEPRRPDLEVRIVVADTGLVVPVVRWLNAARGEWVELDGDGVLYLPEGAYVVEARSGPARTTTVVRVEAHGTTIVPVP